VAPQPSSRTRKIPVGGGIGLLFMAIGVVLILVEVPAARWFLLFSIPVGLFFAGIIYLWHKHKPIKPEDVDNRPLKLDL
jgi:hypothetical protein